MHSDVDAMYSLYLRGASLAQVGRHFGLTRQAVRNIFLRAGLETRSARETALLRREQRLGLGDDVVEAYKRSRDVPAVAHSTGLPRAVVAEIVRDRAPASERRVRARPKTFSDEELRTILRCAAEELGSDFSGRAYDALAARRTLPDGRRWPTHQTHAKRFGSWRAALNAGHVGSKQPIVGRRPRRFEDTDCIAAIRAVAGDLGRAPTVKDYDQAARASGGAVPSAATVRKRHGSWLAALRAAGF